MSKAKFLGFDEELHTIIAALRFWQEKGMCEPLNRSDQFHELATNGGEQTSLCSEDIDVLIDEINVSDGNQSSSRKKGEYRVDWTVDIEHHGSHDEVAMSVAERYFKPHIAAGQQDSACVFEVTSYDQNTVSIDLAALLET